MSSYSLNSSSCRLEDASLLLLYLVVTASALYMAQRYSAFFFAAEYRLILYVLLGGAVLGLRRMVCVPLVFWILGVVVAWSGVHTYLLSDAKLAIHATSRFVNVMMLAPMAAVLLLHNRRLEKIFQIFMVIFLLAMGTLLYQYWGWGDLNWLVQGYIAIRGNLVRFMTVVGEPNVGGMLASLVFVLGITLSKRRFNAILWGSLAVAFVAFSLSKAALLGMGVGLLVGSLLYAPNERPEVLFRITASGAIGLALIWILGADGYIRVMVDSVLGGIRGEPSALEDFRFRQSSIDWNAIFSQSAIPHWSSYLFGASFFNVGSAAQEIRGLDVGVVLPHNSYLELFFTGGLLLLGLVLFLMVHAGYSLFNSRSTANWPIDRCALICLAMLSAWMLVYPVIYEPVTGSLLWVIVGYGYRPRQLVEAARVLHNA